MKRHAFAFGRQIGLVVLVALVLCTAAITAEGESAAAAQATVLCPVITGSDQEVPFAPHQGWVDVSAPGDSTGRFARIGADAKFHFENPRGPVALIASFDRVETLPIIVGRWPRKPGDYNISLWGDYICVPPGYPETWDQEYKVKARDFFQTFTARSTYLYGLTAFDGDKVVEWGNKIHGGIHEGGPDGPIVVFPGADGSRAESHSAHHTDYEFPYIGWRHGDLPVVPGKEYTVHIGGYRSHGGQNFDLDSFIRPDRGDGYRSGQAYVGNAKNPVEGDLCLILAGNSNGQLVENQIRSEEWDVILPKRVPVKRWGQTFVSHGVSMAGLVFWANNGSADAVSCKVRIRDGGPDGEIIGPTKTAIGHDCPVGPYIRYPDQPGPLEGYLNYYELPCKVYQVAYIPDEVRLEPGKTYYIGLEFTKPVLVYVDGDYYRLGFGYYNGEKVETERHLQHGDKRWTLAATIVTYQHRGGRANR